MKKKQKKLKKKKKIFKKTPKKKVFKKTSKKLKTKRKIRHSIKKRKTKNRIRNIKKEISLRDKKNQNNSLVLKLVKLQMALKPEFNIKFNFSLEKSIQGFFDKISETISSYKILKADEKRRVKLKIEMKEIKNRTRKKKKYERDLKLNFKSKH